jgi:hypothetical protein
VDGRGLTGLRAAGRQLHPIFGRFGAGSALVVCGFRETGERVGNLVPHRRERAYSIDHFSADETAADSTGRENIGKSYAMALSCSSGDVAAVQSVSVMTR